MTDSQSFDAHADSYRSDMHAALGRLGGESSYYLAEKVRLLKKIVGHHEPRRILDFGSGVGEAVPFLLEAFSPDQLVCTDESKESLKRLQNRFPTVSTTEFDKIPHDSIDLIFVANVLHHIEPRERLELFRTLIQRLRNGGLIATFEHNPYNPVTRRIVSNCVFDEGVVLLTKADVKSLVDASQEMEMISSGYCLFVPEPFKKLNWIEGFMRKLPIGGQHFVIAQRMCD